MITAEWFPHLHFMVAMASGVETSCATGGGPKLAYYDRLAQTLADVVTTFPPIAQL